MNFLIPHPQIDKRYWAYIGGHPNLVDWAAQTLTSRNVGSAPNSECFNVIIFQLVQ